MKKIKTSLIFLSFYSFTVASEASKLFQQPFPKLEQPKNYKQALEQLKETREIITAMLYKQASFDHTNLLERLESLETRHASLQASHVNLEFYLVIALTCTAVYWCWIKNT